jgi:hypothetical protein
MVKVFYLLQEIQQKIMHNLPYYNEFKLSYQGIKGRTLEKYVAELKPIDEGQKTDIEKLIEKNKFLFGYRNDIFSPSVLTHIIEYGTDCVDPVIQAKKLGTAAKTIINGILRVSGSKNLEDLREKIHQVINYFYYHPEITEHLGYSLEKHVMIPTLAKPYSDKDILNFDFSYNKSDRVAYLKPNKEISDGVINSDASWSVLSGYQYTIIDSKTGNILTIPERDILGYSYEKRREKVMENGIITWIFTNGVIKLYTDNCIGCSGNMNNKKCIENKKIREKEKCEKDTPLNIRNSIICSLVKGARKITQSLSEFSELKICTECIEEDNMSGVTDQESRESSSISSEPDTGRGAVYGDMHRPSMSSLSSYGESADTNTTTLTDEESQAYDTFKKAVCKASLEEKDDELRKKDDELSKNKDESARALAEKQTKIDDLENAKGKFSLGVKRFLGKTGKKGGKKKSSTKKKRKNVTRRKKKSGKKSKKSRK